MIDGALFATTQLVVDLLGGFLFSGEDIDKKVKVLSGGELSRLSLARLLLETHNLLLMDEPTNHLDLEMRQALAVALQDFSGAMVIVSHDRHLLRVSCDRLMLVHETRVDDFMLSLDDYPGWLNEQGRQAEAQRCGHGSSGVTAGPA